MPVELADKLVFYGIIATFVIGPFVLIFDLRAAIMKRRLMRDELVARAHNREIELLNKKIELAIAMREPVQRQPEVEQIEAPTK